MKSDTVLTTWVIFDHPRDYPNHFVIRSQRVIREQPVRIEHDVGAYLFHTLEDAQGYMRDMHLTQIQGPGDDEDPTIIEVWI